MSTGKRDAPPIYWPHSGTRGLQPKTLLPSRPPAPRLATPVPPPALRAVQAKLLPPPLPARPGVIQRLRGVDLEEASTMALGYAGVKSATEVQGLHVDGCVAMTANTPSAMSGISEQELQTLLVPLSRYGPRITNVKSAVTEESCATKLAAKDGSLVILNAATKGGDLHAEQRLLLVLAYMLKANQVPQTIHVWGAKPPCGTCKGVLQAFNRALDNVYDRVLLFSGVAGQDRGRDALSLRAIFGDPGGDFGRFIAQYEGG